MLTSRSQGLVSYGLGLTARVLRGLAGEAKVRAGALGRDRPSLGFPANRRPWPWGPSSSVSVHTLVLASTWRRISKE